MKHGDVGPDKMYQGGVPVLGHDKAREDLRQFGVPYRDEQCEYYQTSSEPWILLTIMAACLPQDFLPDHAYRICEAVKI
jgi:hypothetical protein